MSLLAPHAAHAQSAPTVDEFIGWLDDPSRQWLATANLERDPVAAIPRLLEPGRAVLAPHGELSPALLTLAKIGEPAVPAIAERVRALRRKDGQYGDQGAEPLIKVLGAIGPGAIPVLVEIAELSAVEDWLGKLALEEIVQMEPLTRHYGLLSPWQFWTARDDRQARLARAVVPMLPRIERTMDRMLHGLDKALGGDFATRVLPAAYLLARWGDSPQRARALQVIEDYARSTKFFYSSVEVIRQLYVLQAPATASLIRLTAPRVPPGNELKAAYLLSMAIALQQLGQRDYGALLDEAIRTGRPVDRMDAATFLGQTEDLANVPRLVALLSDSTPWNGRAVGDHALEALRRLTLQDRAADPGVWHAWLAAHRDATYDTILQAWLNSSRKTMGAVPIWTANAWIAKIQSTRDRRVLPLVMDYLRRPDLAASSVGPNSSRGGGSDGPQGKPAPAVVTLLLGLAQHGVTGAVDALHASLSAADPAVRWFGAMALAAYRPTEAAEFLAGELRSTEAWRRSNVAELLLMLGDARGIPARIEALEIGRMLYGGGTVNAGETTNASAIESSRGIRMFACLDLQVYTQQPLPCDPRATGDALTAQVEAWRSWWKASGAKFAVPIRQADLDRAAMYRIHPVSMGATSVR